MDDRNFSFTYREDIRLLFQMFLTLVVMGLCIGKIVTDEKSDKALFWGGVTSCLAWWMPSPASSVGISAGAIARKILGGVNKGDDE